ncbi:MAG: hypothetical protein WKH68_08345, partial [Candidatus Limnocylindria bacterium]
MRGLAIGLFVAIVAMVGYALGSLVLPGADLMPDHPSLPDFLAFSLIFIAFPAVGLVVIWKRPGNPIGWIFLAIGFGIVASIFATEYAGRVVYVGWNHPAVVFVAWTGGWTWAVATGLMLTFAVLLFPMGVCPERAGGPSRGSPPSPSGSPYWRKHCVPVRSWVTEGNSPIRSVWADRSAKWRPPCPTEVSWRSWRWGFSLSHRSWFAFGGHTASSV